MGRRKVNYGASVALSTQDIQKAVNQLRNYNIMDAMMLGVISPVLQGTWLAVDLNDRPDWIRKLEKEWGIQ